MKENQHRIQSENPRLCRSFFTRDGITLAKELLGKTLVHHTSLGPVRGIVTEVESYMGEEDKGAHTYGGRRTERTEPMYHIGGTSYVYLIYGMYYCMNIAAMEDGIPQAVLIRSVIPADEEAEQRMIALRLQHEAKRKSKKASVSTLDSAGADGDSVKPCSTAEGDIAKDSKVEDSIAENNTAEDGIAENNTAEGSKVKDSTAKGSKVEDSIAEGSTTEDSIVEGNTAEDNTVEDSTAKYSADKIKRLRKHLADGPGKVCIAMGITKEDNDIDLTESDTFYVTEGIPVLTSDIKAGKRIGIDYAEEAAEYLWRFYLDIV